MNFIEIFFLALALSVDAFIVSFSYGLIIKKKRFGNALKLAFAVGFGQFIMPIIGWWGTSAVSRYVEQFDHWLVFLVFGILGLNIIINALETDTKKLEKNLTVPVLAALGIVTSIDALAVGISLHFADVPIFSAAVLIGITTFTCSLIGFNLNRWFKKLPQKYMEIAAGLILISLGVRVLAEHLFGF